MLPFGIKRQQLGVAPWKLVAPPITVHGMGLCLLYGYSLPYACLDGVTVSTAEFLSLPVYGVLFQVALAVMADGCTSETESFFLACVNLLSLKILHSSGVPFLLLGTSSLSHQYTYRGNPYKGSGIPPLHYTVGSACP